MLERLSVRHFLLLDDVDLVFHAGFNVLTGETGAGKSLLMDALDLCLGARAEADLVRPPYDHATLTAVMEVLPDEVQEWLAHQGIPCDDTLILKRVLMRQGKSRAFVNDQPVTLQALRALGGLLVHIHGQFDPLLDPSKSLELIDAYGGLGDQRGGVSEAFSAWREAEKQEHQAREHARIAKDMQDQRTHFLTVLENVHPLPHEEEQILAQREQIRQSLKTAECYQRVRTVLETAPSCARRLQEAQKELEKIVSLDQGATHALKLLQEASVSLQEAEFLLDQHQEAVEPLVERLHQGDERLATLRDTARLLGCTVAELAALRTRWAQEALETDPNHLRRLQEAVHQAWATYQQRAQLLSEARASVAQEMAHHVTALCRELRLNHTHFEVRLTQDGSPQASGMDEAVFMLQTNPGFPAAPLDRVASGGERSRLMLALRTVLSRKMQTPTLIFDEIDSGMSGAVAHTVGGHMASISQHHQVISITHAPQVASQADHHVRLFKDEHVQGVLTQVQVLDKDARVEELARMMAGASITPETRLLAQQMLNPQE